MRSAKRPLILAGLVAAVFAAGCSHYKITDPSTDKVYFTKGYKERAGAVRFTDAKSGADVNIQNAEIVKVSGSEYRDGVKN